MWPRVKGEMMADKKEFVTADSATLKLEAKIDTLEEQLRQRDATIAALRTLIKDGK